MKYLKNFLKKNLVALKLLYISLSFFYKVRLEFKNNKIFILKHNFTIIIREKNIFYLLDIFKNFNSIVDSYELNQKELDFSSPKSYFLKGSDEKFLVSNYSESYSYYEDVYLSKFKIQKGDIVVDIGAFNGIVSIIFAKSVGDKGKVFSVEPDSLNHSCAVENFKNFEKKYGFSPVLIKKAMWDIPNIEIDFVEEGAMGSSASFYLGENRGNKIKVGTETLTSLLEKNQIQRVDYLKIDCEGAELQILSDSNFFKKYKPQIILEVHENIPYVKVKNLLVNYGYIIQPISDNSSYKSNHKLIYAICPEN